MEAIETTPTTLSAMISPTNQRDSIPDVPPRPRPRGNAHSLNVSGVLVAPVRIMHELLTQRSWYRIHHANGNDLKHRK